MIDEVFLLSIECELWAERQLGLIQVDVVIAQMLQCAVQRCPSIVLRFHRCQIVTEFIDRDCFAQAPRNISDVAQGGGQMPFEDVGVQFFSFAAANRFEKIREVAFTPPLKRADVNTSVPFRRNARRPRF